MQTYQSPSPNGAPQWNNNPPSSQAPPAWASPPPNAQYTPRPNQNIPPITQAVPQPGTMVTLQPQHPDHYRALPAPPQMYPPPYHPQMGYPPQPPAPRQRTAIACRYCRRRKIRCSGFDTSEDGRCTNCVRFSQECVFTPVHAQTQAFVPAHAVYRGQNAPPNAQLYGAYGQPITDRGQYPPQGQHPGQYPPPPQGYQQPPMYQQVPAQQAGQKRGNDEPHTPTLPPPGAGQPHGQAFGYPDPSGGASPASSHNSSLNPLYPPPPHYAPPAPTAHRASPQGVYPYEAPTSQQQQQAQAAAMQALAKQEERTTTDSKQGDTTNGAAEGARKEGGVTRQYADVGVQVNLIGGPAKEPDS